MNAIRLSLLLFPLLLAACASAPKPAAVTAEDTVVSGQGRAPSGAGSAIVIENTGPGSVSSSAAIQDSGVSLYAESGSDTIPTDTAEAGASMSAVEATGVSGAVTSHDPDTVPTEAEEDFEALYGSGSASGSVHYDPWERFNREMHGFNNAMDYVLFRPVARGYTRVTPRPVRTGVSNFFSNLKSPVVMVNQLLQGHPAQAGKTLVRFLLNSTLGIGGVLDPASDAKLPPSNADFGQTLGVWGWKSSRYLVLPFFGPRTVRDSFGLAADSVMSPTWYIERDRVRIGTQALGVIDTRAQLLPLDDIRAGAMDDYSLIRDAWMQRRRYLLQNSGRPRADQGVLPDYMNEDVPDQRIP
ncbi:MAG: VacJ family lipoprotein [Xanthomonadaceae bacterium]|jgi:phospholipid-binding lipoprotein MlaA|nr:VacJ family lipoprotein [Xanthomonadaceae bacterium]